MTDEKPKRAPRPAWSYRAARKKAAREQKKAMLRHAPETIDGSFDDSIELNRCPDHTRASDYKYAREIPPSKDAVR